MTLAATPLLVPLLTALATGLCAGRPQVARAASLVGGAAFVACAAAILWRVSLDGEPLATSFGSWPEPMAIGFHIDRLGAVLIAVTAVIGWVTLVYAEFAHPSQAALRHVVPLVHGLLAAAAGAFATADLFNLYVWFELLLLCTVGLLAAGGKLRAIDAAFKYLALNLFATALLLGGVALLYGLTGRLAFADLAGGATGEPALREAVLGLLLVALLIKSAAFPFFTWMPASYPSLPTPLLALSAGLLTKVGIYAILRLLGGVFAGHSATLEGGLGWIACATMVVGVLGAVHHYDVRRLLVFHAISQNGYLLLGVALASVGGAAAAIFYTVHYIVVKTNLFLIAGLVRAECGSHDLRRCGGLFPAHPGLALLFGISALSLVGVPPFSGFWAKLLVVREALATGRWVWAAVALAVSLLTLLSMAKIWSEAFWKPAPERAAPLDRPLDRPLASPRLAYACVVVLTAFTLAIGLWPGPLIELAQDAAGALRAGYAR